MAQVWTWREVLALRPTQVERRLIRKCKAGQPCGLGDLSRPETADPARTIRADLLRYLILDGCEHCRVAGAGVQLRGAWVAGQLDLNWATARGPVGLFACRFAEQITAMQAHLPALDLNGSALPGLDAQDVQVAGNVFLSDGFHASGEVHLSGARIGGQLACDGGRFAPPEGDALNAQGARVTGDVFFSSNFHASGEVSLAGARIGGQLACAGGRFETPEGMALNAQGARVTGGVFLSGIFDRDEKLVSAFHASGEVSLAGAQIGGQLNCIGGRFETPWGNALDAQSAQVTDDVFLSDGFHASGEVNLSGTRVIGQIDCEGGRFGKTEGGAFIGQGMRVNGSFIWRSVTVDDGTVSPNDAHVGDLVDDPESWPDGGRVILDGFTYNRIAASFTDARRRLEWLAKGDSWDGEFFPQPYTQLARVLRAMGHERAARDVLVERERRLRAQARREARIVPDGSVRAGLLSIWRDLTNIIRWGWDIITRWTIGYGHRPVQSVYALLLLFIVATVLADRAWQAGHFAPASDVILTSPGWQALAGTEPNPARAWSAADGPGRDWESFNRYAFAADVVIPIIDFGQTQAWAPSATREPWGWHLWWARWVLSGLGWIVTALGTAAVTGIIGRARE